VVLRFEGLLAGGFPVEIAIKECSRFAIGEHQMLDDVLRGPGSGVAAESVRGAKLAGSAFSAAEGFAVTTVQVFEYGMHG